MWSKHLEWICHDLTKSPCYDLYLKPNSGVEKSHQGHRFGSCGCGVKIGAGEAHAVWPQVKRHEKGIVDLSGPVLRDTARLSQRYPPIARYGVFGVSTWPIGRDTPSPFSQRFTLGEHAKWRCDTPPPTKGVSQRYLRDTLQNKAKCVRYPALSRKGIARYGGVSRTGPLSCGHSTAQTWRCNFTPKFS